jgi:DNA invertase Pin-like site-specific DNA recombinase
MSKFLMHLFAAFAEMERGIIRERVCAGVVRGEGPRNTSNVFRRDEAPKLRVEG